MTLSERILRPFSRVTSSGLFIPEIDGLRFIAVTIVFVLHLTGFVSHRGTLWGPAGACLYNHIVVLGYSGVSLFFAISGFILGLPFARQYLAQSSPVSLKKYYLRRLTRLEPPYIIQYGIMSLITAGVICFALNTTSEYPSTGRLIQQAIVGLFYQHTLVYGELNVLNGVLWSLEVEVQFYVLAPFLALLFSRRKSVRRGCMAALIVFSSAMAYAFNDVTRINLSIVAQLQFFMVGFLLADWYTTERQPSAQPRSRSRRMGSRSCVARWRSAGMAGAG